MSLHKNKHFPLSLKFGTCFGNNCLIPNHHACSIEIIEMKYLQKIIFITCLNMV